MYIVQSPLNVCCGTVTNSGDPDERPWNAAFHQDPHCLLRQKQSSEKEIQFYFEIITCDPLIYTMDLPKLIVSTQKEDSISALRVNMSMALNLVCCQDLLW